MSCRVTIAVWLILALITPNHLLAQGERAASVEDKVTKYSQRKNATVVVTLRSGEVINGRVEHTAPDSFTVTNKDSNESTTIAYTDVADIKKAGLHPALKVAIVCGIVGGAAAAIVFGIRGSGCG